MALTELVRILGGLALSVVLPGVAAARFLARARHPFDLAWQTVIASMLVFTPLVYPAALLAGAPTVVAIALPLAVFAAISFVLQSKIASVPFWNETPSGPWLWVPCLLWFAKTTIDGLFIVWCPSLVDTAWFVGLLRELSTHTPAENPELAGRLLTLPSGSWFWYACVQRLTGLETQRALFVLGPLIAVSLLAVVHRVSRVIFQDETAAVSSILLLLVPSDLEWMRLVGAYRGTGGVASFANRTLFIAWYNGPALILLLLVVAAVVRLLRSPNDRPTLIALLALLVLFTFHHPLYYGMALLGVAPALVWAVAKRRLDWPVLLCLLTWVPWKLLAVVWPDATLVGEPRLTLEMSRILPDLGKTALRHLFILPFAVYGIHRVRGPGVAALLGVLVVVLLPGPWAGPWNRHWQWDPLALCLALFAGVGVANLLRSHRFFPISLAAFWALPNVARAAREVPWRPSLHGAERRSARCDDPPGLREAALWLRTTSPSNAVVATRPGSLAGRYVEMYAARRLAFGEGLHFELGDPAPTWRPTEQDVRSLYEVERSDELSAIVERRHIDYIVVHCDEKGVGCPSKSAALSNLPVVFQSFGVSILDARE